MRIAVISDIHGNLEAFSQVLADLEQKNPDKIINLGDIVGYGPDPEAVVRMIRTRSISSVMGNHELALKSEQYFSRLNEVTQQSIIITQRLLSADSMKFLRNLPPVKSFCGGRFVHGCPPESSTVYLFDPSEKMLRKLAVSFPESVCFVGHTHNLSQFEINRNKIRKKTPDNGIITLDSESKYIMAVGSVGQPRDGLNNNAKYVIWDTEEHSLEVRFVPYDASLTAEKIIRLGFPKQNATRLL